MLVTLLICSPYCHAGLLRVVDELSSGVLMPTSAGPAFSAPAARAWAAEVSPLFTFHPFDHMLPSPRQGLQCKGANLPNLLHSAEDGGKGSNSMHDH